jgi:hypothetical protein
MEVDIMTSNINGVYSNINRPWYFTNINEGNNTTNIIQQIKENKFNHQSYTNRVESAMSSYFTSLGSFANSLESATSHMISSNSDSNYNKKGAIPEENITSININRIQRSFINADDKKKNYTEDFNSNSLKTNIKNIVNNYNNLINNINDNSINFGGAQKLGYELGSIVNSRKTSLESIGVTINKDNSLTIDDNKLDKSINNSFYRVEDIFKGYNGIADKLNIKSNEIIAAPSKYAKPSELNNGVNDYYNYMSSTYKLPYSLNFNPGLLINTTA